MKRYEKYKPSGVEWIGEVPEGWEKIHLKYTTLCKDGLFIDGDWIESKDLTTDSDGIRYLTSGNVGIINYKEQGDGYITEKKFKELDCTEVFPGDIIISRLNEPIGRACIVPQLNKRIVCAVDNVICRTNDSLYDKKYLVYQMNCKAYSEYANCLARGTGMHRISRSMLGQMTLLVPPLPEQTAIATYLDAKCTKIDNVVAVQQKRIEVLKELKQSIITHAVTRGLDKNAKLKDSGVEWIGEVPEGWKVMKLDFACKTITDYVASGSFADLRDNVTYLDDPDYAMLVRTADLSQKNKNISRVYVSKESYEFLNNSNLYGGEIVLPNIGASIGDAYMVPSDLYPKMTLAPNSVLLRTKYEDKYFYYFFCSKSGREALENIGQASAQGKFNKTDLRQMKIIVPPLSEQTAIATYLDKKCAIIDNQIAKVERQIELLKEYKQSVITECVTGKRKVC